MKLLAKLALGLLLFLALWLLPLALCLLGWRRESRHKV
jgi:hypothetical protein